MRTDRVCLPVSAARAAVAAVAVVAVVGVLGASACGSSRGASARQAGSATSASAASGLTLTFESPALSGLIEEHWQWRLRRSPVFATTLGDHRYDDQLGAVAHGEVLAEQRERRGFLERAVLLA